MKKSHLYFRNDSKTHIYVTHIYVAYIIHVLIFETKFRSIFILFLKFDKNNFTYFLKIILHFSLFSKIRQCTPHQPYDFTFVIF